MCDKVKYKTKGAAISGAISASKKTGKGMRPYPCPKCKKFHLSSKPRKTVAELAAEHNN